MMVVPGPPCGAVPTCLRRTGGRHAAGGSDAPSSRIPVVVAAGAGFPISQLAIRRFGRPGAAGVTAVSGGILAMDLANLATGRSQGDLRRLVRLEAAATSAATVTGALLLLDPVVTEAVDSGWRVGRSELFAA